MNTPNQPAMQQVQIPGIIIQITGLKAKSHLIAIAQKRRQMPFDAGTDLIPASTYTVNPYEGIVEIRVDTFVHMVPPPGVWGFITERSSTIKMLNGGRVGSGVIDAGYTGELKIRVLCHPDQLMVVSAAIEKCSKEMIPIAQIIFLPCFFPQFHETDKLVTIGNRGNNGFGSTNNSIHGKS